MSKEDNIKEINRSIRRCEETLKMLEQLPLFHPERKKHYEQCKQDILMLNEVREKLIEK